MEELKVFFWGIFKNIEEIKERIGIEPDEFIDAELVTGYRWSDIVLKGKLAIWRNRPEKEYYEILGRLSLVEIRHYLLDVGYAKVKNGKYTHEYECLYYYPAKKDFYKMLAESKSKGSLKKLDL